MGLIVILYSRYGLIVFFQSVTLGLRDVAKELLHSFMLPVDPKALMARNDPLQEKRESKHLKCMTTPVRHGSIRETLSKTRAYDGISLMSYKGMF